MARILQYYVRQDNRRNGNGMWYGKAYIPNKVTLEQIAQRIQQNASIKKSDVYAFLTEFFEVINDALKNGKMVKFGKIGYFQIGMKSKGALAADKWKVNEHLASVKIRFRTVNEVESGATTRAVYDTSGLKFIKVEGPEKKATPNP